MDAFYNIISHASVQTCKSHSQLSCCGLPMVLRIAAAFPLCTAIDMRCRRYSRLRGSPVILKGRRPSSLTNSSAASPSTPDVSTAKGTKSGFSSGVRTSPILPSQLVRPQFQPLSQQRECARVRRCLGMWHPRRALSHFSKV